MRCIQFLNGKNYFVKESNVCRVLDFLFFESENSTIDVQEMMNSLPSSVEYNMVLEEMINYINYKQNMDSSVMEAPSVNFAVEFLIEPFKQKLRDILCK